MLPKGVYKICLLGTRSFSKACGQAPYKPSGPGLIRSSLPPQLLRNCWGTLHGYISTITNGHPQRLIGLPRWQAPPNFTWLGPLLIFLLIQTNQADPCESSCMRGSGTFRYFSAFTYMPAICYRGKKPTTCTYDQKTYWVSDLVTAKRGIAPCNIYPRTGKVCWTYLGHVGLSDGGGVQDQASRKRIKTAVIDLTKRL